MPSPTQRSTARLVALARADDVHGRLARLALDCGGYVGLSELSGVPTKTIAGWFRTRSLPSLSHLVSVCRACRVSADWLLGLPAIWLDEER